MTHPGQAISATANTINSYVHSTAAENYGGVMVVKTDSGEAYASAAPQLLTAERRRDRTTITDYVVYRKTLFGTGAPTSYSPLSSHSLGSLSASEARYVK